MGDLLQVACLHEELGGHVATTLQSRGHSRIAVTLYMMINHTIKQRRGSETVSSPLPIQSVLTLYLADELLELRRFRLIS